MTADERINAWMREIVDDKCETCIDNCCTPDKHAIWFYASEMELFDEFDIPVFYEYHFDKKVLDAWIGTPHPHPVLYTKEGEGVKMPSLVQIRPSSFLMYVERYCPFFEEGSGCLIHDDPRRPKVCKDYPLDVRKKEGIIHVEFQESCKGFNSPDVVKDFKETFPDYKLHFHMVGR